MSKNRVGKRQPNFGSWASLAFGLLALAAYGAAVGASDKSIMAFNNATPLDKAISFTFDPYPLDHEFWDNRGKTLKALGRTTEANAAFAKVKELGYQE